MDDIKAALRDAEHKAAMLEIKVERLQHKIDMLEIDLKLERKLRDNDKRHIDELTAQLKRILNVSSDAA